MIKRTFFEIPCSCINLVYVAWRKGTIYKTSQAGQIAVEYILLLAVGVTLAAFVTSSVVSRNNETPGILIAKWEAIISIIANDEIENKLFKHSRVFKLTEG